MSRNIMTITKWVPLDYEDNNALYLECKQLRRSTQELIEKIGLLLNEFKFANTSKVHAKICDSALLVENLENIVDVASMLKDGFHKAFFKLNIDKPLLTEIKVQFWKNELWKSKLKLCYFLQQCVSDIAYLFVYYGDKILSLTLKISNTFNQCLHLDTKYGIKNHTSVCSNTCPYLMHPLRKISITRLLQILAQNRAELCCHKLIDCLLETYKLYDGHDEDNGSDNSSVEIYRAITRHMSPPANILDVPKDINKSDVEDSSSFVNMEELIDYEEQNILNFLEIALRIAPSMLGNDGVKKSKNGDFKICNEAKDKVLDYYQQILWGEVGNFLEHIILWWGLLPLSTRPPHSSQHLREWINQFTPTVDVPQFIKSAMSCLSDGLGVHVASTSWDQHFRLALVASKSTCNPDTGRLFCEMLHDLIALSNQCEVTSEWIAGAPLDELPLVEQIPVLHRLDHSIHTMRLWALNESRKLANNWNVESFFMITHCDIVNCLAQLDGLRVADHTAEIEKNILSVHVQVCATMREKLVSEIKENIHKLKEAPSQCVDCLACVCRTISLANLKMIFPGPSLWRRSSNELPNNPCDYVQKFVEQVLTPILAATEDHRISNMILKIMCEAWLDHIYMNRVKFSQFGAMQLLMDFAYVSTWIINCPIISQVMRKKMLKNELLRRCEGVGRLLLRSPGERIKMSEKKKSNPEYSPKSDNTELMPAEMYVPNQEQWLELRANKKKVFLTSLCCGDMNI